MEKDFTIAETFTLPSRGVIYANPINPEIRLKSMTGADEMKRNANNDGTNETLAEIVDSCIVGDKEISAYDMAYGDFEFLVHKLRIVSHGSDYRILCGCPSCGTVAKTVVDLDMLQVKEFNSADYESAISFQLPVSNRNVKIKMETPRIQDKIIRQINSAKLEAESSGAKVNEELIKLMNMLDTVDGKKLMLVEQEQFLKGLPLKDFNYIAKKVIKAKDMIGENPETIVTCGKCGKPFKTYFRYSNEFFRPEID